MIVDQSATHNNYTESYCATYEYTITPKLTAIVNISQTYTGSFTVDTTTVLSEVEGQCMLDPTNMPPAPDSVTYTPEVYTDAAMTTVFSEATLNTSDLKLSVASLDNTYVGDEIDL